MTFTQWQQRMKGYNHAINDVFLNKVTNELLIYYIGLTRNQHSYYFNVLASAAIMILRQRKERLMVAK